jgi:hypothetical protein
MDKDRVIGGYDSMREGVAKGARPNYYILLNPSLN